MKVFLSYNFEDETFVAQVNSILREQPGIKPYLWYHNRRPGNWKDQLSSQLDESEVFILFLGEEIEGFQLSEAEYMMKSGKLNKVVVVRLPGACSLPESLNEFEDITPLPVSQINDVGVRKCAKEIVMTLGVRWYFSKGIPEGYPFCYEKDILDTFKKNKGHLPADLVEKGCVRDWPDVKRRTIPEYKNDLSKELIGFYGPFDQMVTIVDEDPNLYVFPEARPRKKLYFNRHDLNIGIVVSGGIAPGINAAISAIIDRHRMYAEASNPEYKLHINGFRDGFYGILENNVMDLSEPLVDEIKTKGGSIIGTSRTDEIIDDPGKIKKLVTQLDALSIDILYIIGGDGSIRASHAIYATVQQMKELDTLDTIDKEISIIAIPKAMDNDVLWVWQSMGFLSSIDVAKDIVLKLYTEVTANPRLCVVQLFGTDSGFVVAHAAIASGVCDVALIPEYPFTIKKLSEYLIDRMYERRRQSNSRYPYGMILMAETSIPEDWQEYVNEEKDKIMELTEDEKEALNTFEKNKRRFIGQTPDFLRSAALKLVANGIKSEIKDSEMKDVWEGFRIFTNEPRHIIRAASPNTTDIIFAQRLGILAVDNALAGYTDCMITQWLSEYVLVPLELVILGRKRVPTEGMFWKQVLFSTGQPVNLSE